jgi:hypothetical protein
MRNITYFFGCAILTACICDNIFIVIAGGIFGIVAINLVEHIIKKLVH